MRKIKFSIKNINKKMIFCDKNFNEAIQEAYNSGIGMYKMVTKLIKKFLNYPENATFTPHAYSHALIEVINDPKESEERKKEAKELREDLKKYYQILRQFIITNQKRLGIKEITEELFMF